MNLKNDTSLQTALHQQKHQVSDHYNNNGVINTKRIIKHKNQRETIMEISITSPSASRDVSMGYGPGEQSILTMNEIVTIDSYIARLASVVTWTSTRHMRLIDKGEQVYFYAFLMDGGEIGGEDIKGGRTESVRCPKVQVTFNLRRAILV